MGLKINKLYIKNFKVFEEVTIDFSQTQLTVLDGPNGFGKTTVYDAIELLFTGQIRRYNSIGNIIDNRENFVELPFYNVNGDGSPIVIKAEIELPNGNVPETRVIIRKTEDKASLERSRVKHDFSVFKLFEADSFDSVIEDYKAVDNPVQFLTDILGVNYRQNFEFLNYVEQEESYYMLKHKDKERKDNIQHLFNTKEFQTQLSKVKAIRQQIHKLADPLNKDIGGLEDKIKNIKENLSDNEEAEYKQLFENKDFIWDQETIDFTTLGYTDILGKEGVITKLENLISNRNIFKAFIKNEEIQKVIDGGKNVLIHLLKFDEYADQKEKVFNEKSLLISITDFLGNNNTIDSKNVTEGLLNLDDNISGRFSEKEEVVSYNMRLDSIKELVKSSNKTSKLFSDLTNTRDNLIEYFKKFNSETEGESGSCPLCGYNWETQQELLAQIDFQTEELKDLSKIIADDLTKSINHFKENEFRLVLDMLSTYKRESFYNEEYFSGFSEVDSKKIQAAKGYLQVNEVKFTDLINKDTNPKATIKTDELITRLKEQITEIDSDKVQDYFKEFFLLYFDEVEELLFEFDITELESKRKYIAWQYSLYQNSQLLTFTKEHEAKRSRLELLTQKESDLKKLEKVYVSSLKKYNAEVIKDIELLFHIYSGRILLDYQGGLGLFIKNDKDGLRFVTNPTRTYDALFSMSAGQLSALIISFTFALNKIYSKNKVLFIDDPVQTMDEINISGCIELLRNEFADRQIFISTHESMMSTYIRYKFEKYNLSTIRINVKELAS